jgi:hypothetical protein
MHAAHAIDVQSDHVRLLFGTLSRHSSQITG